MLTYPFKASVNATSFPKAHAPAHSVLQQLPEGGRYEKTFTPTIPDKKQQISE